MSRLDGYFDPPCMFGPYKEHGVYAVCAKACNANSSEHVLYIGSSQNMYRRLTNERHPYRRIFNRAKGWHVYTRAMVTRDFRNAEVEMIRKMRPLLNIQHNGKALH